MVQTAFLLVSLASIAVILFALVSVLRLRRRIPGGKARGTWNILTGMISAFAVGYVATPFFAQLPEDVRLLVVGLIFLLGAVFVVMVIRLFGRVIEDLGM